MTKFGAQVMKGLKLAEALRTEADDCQNEEREKLLRAAADEITSLVGEVRQLEAKVAALDAAVDAAKDYCESLQQIVQGR